MVDNKKKQIPLRVSAKLYNQIAAWAEDDFRSINGQIEYLLTECVKQRKKDGKYVSETIDEPFEIDIEWGIMIKVNNVNKSFGKKVAVNNVTFEVKPGEIFGFLGPNGAGKTTTIKMIVGLLHPDSGSISYPM